MACPVREDHLYHEESSREPTHGRTPSEQGVGAGEISGCRGGRANAARQKEKERGEREVIKTRARGRGGERRGERGGERREDGTGGEGGRPLDRPCSGGACGLWGRRVTTPRASGL